MSDDREAENQHPTTPSGQILQQPNCELPVSSALQPSVSSDEYHSFSPASNQLAAADEAVEAMAITTQVSFIGRFVGDG